MLCQSKLHGRLLGWPRLYDVQEKGDGGPAVQQNLLKGRAHDEAALERFKQNSQTKRWNVNDFDFSFKQIYGVSKSQLKNTTLIALTNPKIILFD